MKKASGRYSPLDDVKHGMVAEPTEGHSDQEVLDLLGEFGIEADVLAEGFVSTSVARQQLDALGPERYADLQNRLEAIARVSPKHKCQIQSSDASLVNGEIVKSEEGRRLHTSSDVAANFLSIFGE